jgi:hypothetical protein
MKNFKKQKEFSKILDLEKVDIADLTASQLSNVKGGAVGPNLIKPPPTADECPTDDNCTYSCAANCPTINQSTCPTFVNPNLGVCTCATANC